MNAISYYFWKILYSTPKGKEPLKLAKGSTVLVPFCGKTNDILWLLEEGYQVIGVELSPLAVEAFFTENNLQATKQQQKDFIVYKLDELQIFCGDFFALQATDLTRIDGVYDRGALVALPAKMRNDYVLQMQALLKPNAQILLVSLEYPEAEISGPPFSISPKEIDNLYALWCEIKFLKKENILEDEPHLKARGLTQLYEQVYQLKVK